jgi:8-oxo-dGTP diphosphatase
VTNLRHYPVRPIVGVGAVILDGARVLLVKRAHEPLKGEWSLPGGAVELGETLETALVREVIEETGLDVVVGPVVEVLDRVQRAPDGRVEYHFVIVDYLCTVRAGVVANGSDASDVRWVSVSELSDHRVTDKAIEVILKAVDLQAR